MSYLALPLQALLGTGIFPLASSSNNYDINNDILYDTRLRLNMNAKVWDNVKFSGRLAMYKSWGDSTGTQVFDSWRAFTMDGTNGGNTTGDYLRVDRAYMDWSNIADTGFYLSIGRRPSTYGPPTDFRENELRGGTPTGNVMFLNFDGITVGRSLEDWTGIEGMVARFCYGQGFESEWGNGELFNDLRTPKTPTSPASTSICTTTAPTSCRQPSSPPRTLTTVSRVRSLSRPNMLSCSLRPCTKTSRSSPTSTSSPASNRAPTIGDINLAGLVFSREEDNGIKWFTSAGWTQMRPNGNAGMFGGMGTDAVFEAELNSDGTEIIMVPKNATEDKNRNGYGFYAGVQVPAPIGKAGLEYNYGSKYWTPFTQGQDDSLGSKLATRGHVGEAYYIFDINPRMSIKLAGIYYDFEYTNSGSPVGKPQKVDDVKDGKAYSLLPVIDTAYDLNATRYGPVLS